MSLTYKNHIKTGNSIIVMFKERDPISVPKENPEYERTARLLAAGRYDMLPKVVDRVERIIAASKGAYSVVDGRVVIDEAPLPTTLSDRILEFVDKDLPIQTFLNFWRNLAENPTDSARTDLYDFLEKNHVPLTEDGCFIAYKKVKSDYWDSHTGKTHQYTPGSVAKMPREAVDSNRNNTCSSGLHVAGFDYAKTFSGSKLLEVKVNPKNVCAVPPDYNYTKIRVCELEVIRECPKYMDEDVQYYDEDKATGFEDTDEKTADEFDGQTEEDLSDADLDEDTSNEEEIATISPEPSVIRRLPSWLRWLVPTTDGRLRVPIKALEKIGVESGQTIYAYVQSKRSRSIILTPEEPMGVLKKKDLVVGTASVRIPASFFKAAQIQDYEEYKLACSKGTLILRAG